MAGLELADPEELNFEDSSGREYANRLQAAAAGGEDEFVGLVLRLELESRELRMVTKYGNRLTDDLFRQIEESLRSLDYLLQRAKRTEATTFLHAQVRNNLAVVFFEREDYVTALNYLEEARDDLAMVSLGWSLAVAKVDKLQATVYRNLINVLWAEIRTKHDDIDKYTTLLSRY